MIAHMNGIQLLKLVLLMFVFVIVTRRKMTELYFVLSLTLMTLMLVFILWVMAGK
jgi:uncharacterized membrane protein YjgN (DUF898 family)